MAHKNIKKNLLLILLCMMCFCTDIKAYANEIDTNNVDTITSLDESLNTKDFIANLKLNSKQDNEIVRFDVKNMFPGDSIVQTYNIAVSYKDDITIKFYANIKEDSEKLTEVLKTKILLGGTSKTLYDGLLCDLPDSIDVFLETDESVTENVQYIITTYLDTSLGNEYINQSLDVDFKWWVDDVEKLDSPKMGDDTHMMMWGAIMILSAGSVIFLIIKRKKESMHAE